MLLCMEPKVFWQLIEAYPKLGYASMYNINANININGALQLNIMPPLDLMNKLYTEQFDPEYISYIISQDQPFFQFMYPVIDLNNGNDVILFVYNEQNIFAPIIEVILKLIQQRYGYNYQLLDNVFDFDPYQYSGMTAPGITQYQIDRQRWDLIMIRTNPDFFTKEIVSDEHL